MKPIIRLLFAVSLLLSSSFLIAQSDPVLVIHGGAGYMTKENLSEEKQEAYKKALEKALTHGYAVLSQGATAMDAVTETIIILENDSLFNSGRGAVFAASGKNELDASIMNGTTLEAGAVGGVQLTKNPITAARAVMERSPHVMMVGAGADDFARDYGCAMVKPEYFYTHRSWQALQRAKKSEKEKNKIDKKDKHGTVGAVALDRYGNIAAGTSTGGMTNKKNNRIGDSPIIGAGTYADSRYAGVSCTGHGEYFIRNVVAYQIIAMMKYGQLSSKEAGDTLINITLKEQQGAGGAIILDKDGNVSMPFNTSGMYRGFKNEKETVIRIFAD